MANASRTDLPVGTYVRVTEHGLNPRPPYIAKVVGTDMGCTKYEVGVRYAVWRSWRFLDGGTWAFPSQVEEISEAEATRVE